MPKVSVEWAERLIEERRAKDHPEYGDAADLAAHVRRAFGRLGHRELDTELKDRLVTLPEQWTPHSAAGQAFYVARDAQAVRRSKQAHGTSTYSRYQDLYEPLDTLWRTIPVRVGKRPVLGLNAWTRRAIFDAILAACEGVERPRILEVGCGFGGNMLLLQHLAPHAELWGFEYTHARLASSLVNLAGTGMEERLFLGDATRLSLEDNSFDVVFSFHVLEQLGQGGATAALGEMARIARRGVVCDEPGEPEAGPLERWRMRRLEYCRDLGAIADEIEGIQRLSYEESPVRAWPNTSRLLQLRKG